MRRKQIIILTSLGLGLYLAPGANSAQVNDSTVIQEYVETMEHLTLYPKDNQELDELKAKITADLNTVRTNMGKKTLLEFIRRIDEEKITNTLKSYEVLGRQLERPVEECYRFFIAAKSNRRKIPQEIMPQEYFTMPPGHFEDIFLDLEKNKTKITMFIDMIKENIRNAIAAKEGVLKLYQDELEKTKKAISEIGD